MEASFWNTPLQWVVEQGPRQDTLAFQVDLWSAHGELPCNLANVVMRQKEIQYSSRTRANTHQFKQYQRARKTLASFLSKLPPDLLASEEARTRASSIADDKVYSLVHLIYRSKHYAGPLQGSRVFPAVHGGDFWRAGYHDAMRGRRAIPRRSSGPAIRRGFPRSILPWTGGNSASVRHEGHPSR